MSRYFTVTVDVANYDDPFINENEVREEVYQVFRKSKVLDASHVEVVEDR